MAPRLPVQVVTLSSRDVSNRGGVCAVCERTVSPLGAHYRSGSAWEHALCHDNKIEERVRNATQTEERATASVELEALRKRLWESELRASAAEENNRRLASSGLLGTPTPRQTGWPNSNQPSQAPVTPPGAGFQAPPRGPPPAPTPPPAPAPKPAPEAPKNRFELIDMD
jgi:hypothetical protein